VDKELKNKIVYFVIGLIALFVVQVALHFLFPSSELVLFGSKGPDLIPDAECKLITSKIAEENNFSVNKSNDYYADIYYLRILDPATDVVMEVKIRDSIIPVSYESFPENRTEFSYDLSYNGEGGTENMNVIARWDNVPPVKTKRLMIFYDANQKNFNLLKSNARTFNYYASDKNGNSKKGNMPLSCSDFDYFYKFKYS
jgi:DNA polymerase sigma